MESTAENENRSQYEFKAEVKQLLDILVHSLYTSREIFLRELISNASDALDRLRFEAQLKPELAGPELTPEIRITFDKDNKTITIRDTGIGMTREEVIQNIGTIAKSGSAEFIKKLSEESGNLENIIGKFGVGFYSVFMVAREVVLKTKSYIAEEPGVEWRSDGLGTYEITPLEGEDLKRGTVIEVRLKDDTVDFADRMRLEGIIKKHSNFISFPIFVQDEQVNTIPAIWREPKFSIKKEQYDEFYKFLTFDAEEPLETIHISVDAPVQFSSLLFIPSSSFDIPGVRREPPGLDLYVRRVLIQHENKDLAPEYLGFLRGVVDSQDLPLNISRESLQENIVVSKMTSVITRDVLSHLQKIARDDPERYSRFWKAHGRVFKLGYSDFLNREKFIPLLRFNSSRNEDAAGLISLDEYIDRAKPDQKEIYYVSGPSRESFAMNPHLEMFRDKDLEVLYLFDPIDEFALEGIHSYREFTVKSVEHTDPKSLDAFESKKDEDKLDPLDAEEEKAFAKLLDRMKDILGDRVTEVRASARLSESPCCLVNPDGGMTSSMQKIMQIIGKDASIPKKIMEVNKDHQFIRNLLAICRENPRDEYLTSAVEQLFESSLLLEGYLKDPHAMVARIQDLLNKSSRWYLAAGK